MRDEALVLVGRIRRPDGLHEQPVEVGRAHPVEHELVDVSEPARAEVVVAVGVEVLVRQPAVRGELLFVAEILAVADLEVASRGEVYPRPAPGDQAERAPLQQRLHRPREVVVQARQRNVGRGVRVVDRMDLIAAHQALARVELPVEERVDKPADRQHLLAQLGREEVMGDLVAVVHRLVRAELHDHRLGADRQRPCEHVEVLDRGLQVHQAPARGVVGALELLAVAYAADADPLSAVVGLHEQRVADLLRDRRQVERLVVAGGRVLEAGVVGRVLVRHQNRRRHLQPEPDHRAVGRVLLHRLEREGTVEQVHVVHQRDLLQPLAREVVPVRETVDHELVARSVAQVERLHRDPLGRDAVAFA